MNKLLCLLLLALVSPAGAEEQSAPPFHYKPIRLVADDWCPQHCEHNQQYKGYIIELVEQALQAEQVPFSISYQPWLRALKAVENGEFDGLLTPTLKGYPQFIFHNEAVGYQDYCFYTRNDSDWNYHQYADLLGKRLGFLKDSGFGELDSYLKQHSDQITVQQFPGGKGYTSKIFDFLERGRADVIVMTSDVYQFSLKTGAINDSFRSAGCLDHERLAVGLSPKNSPRSQEIARVLDKGILKLRENGELQKILLRYGIPLWESPALHGPHETSLQEQ